MEGLVCLFVFLADPFFFGVFSLILSSSFLCIIFDKCFNPIFYKKKHNPLRTT